MAVGINELIWIESLARYKCYVSACCYFRKTEKLRQGYAKVKMWTLSIKPTLPCM